MRVAKNAGPFIRQAESILGFPVEVIAGREEARLIFSGVAHSAPEPLVRQLVIDIGGGSTEFSVGLGFEPALMESLYMGSINYTMTHFPGGFIDDFTMKQAELAARRELQVISASVAVSGWQSAVASSGTARSIARVLRENKVSDGEITPEGMRWMRKAMLCCGRIDSLNIGGLKPERALNLPGGFAILSAIISELNIQSLKVADNSLRLGVLYDLLARAGTASAPEDKRKITIAQFAQRYHTDNAQAARVAALAARFMEQLGAGRTGHHDAEAARYVEWAARLHETGLTIAHNGYHRHSAYIIANADMPGFSRQEQKRLAFLILGHTGKLPKLTAAEPPPLSEWLAVACLRLAALFHRSRQTPALPEMELRFDGRHLSLEIDAQWLDRHSLTAYSLEQEIKHWQALGEARPFKLAISQTTVPA